MLDVDPAVVAVVVVVVVVIIARNDDASTTVQHERTHEHVSGCRLIVWQRVDDLPTASQHHERCVVRTCEDRNCSHGGAIIPRAALTIASFHEPS